jgi:mycofactocin precursor
MNDELITEVAKVSSDADRAEQATTEGGIIDELLIEEISIDGMCGVY